MQGYLLAALSPVQEVQCSLRVLTMTPSSRLQEPFVVLSQPHRQLGQHETENSKDTEGAQQWCSEALGPALVSAPQEMARRYFENFCV